MRVARSRSFAFTGSKSTIKLLITLPAWTIDKVLKMFRISFVAVPAFSRVEPVNSSGPRFGEITTAGRHDGCGQEPMLPSGQDLRPGLPAGQLRHAAAGPSARSGRRVRQLTGAAGAGT